SYRGRCERPGDRIKKRVVGAEQKPFHQLKLVVDTNIVFSALINTNNRMVEILLHPENRIKFYAPYLLKEEITRYQEKLAASSKLSSPTLTEVSEKIIDKLVFISEDLISTESWNQAFKLVSKIDQNDTPFVALAIDLNCQLWTGDKKLAQGLQNNSHLVITTAELNY
ncbi:MAG: PIN domain-containing protein, partial [Bacteroidota bacterium]